ncbi:hypothetical protein D3C78_1620820 [compost metagenome]
MAACIAGALVIVQLGALFAGQARIREEMPGALLVVRLQQHRPVQMLHDKHRRLGLAAVQDGKAAVAQLAQQGRLGDDRRQACGEEVFAL